VWKEGVLVKQTPRLTSRSRDLRENYFSSAMKTEGIRFFETVIEIRSHDTAPHRRGWSRDDVLDLYLEGVRFESRPDHRLLWADVSWFLLVLLVKCRDSASVRPRHLPSKSFYHPTLCSLDTESVVK
jgi:hypothetical protein